MRMALKVLVSIVLCLALGPAVWAAPRPSLTITAVPFPLVINQSARITIAATNTGPDGADNVVITNAVPNNIAIVNVTTTQGSIRVFNSAITVYVGRLEPNQTVAVYVDVVVVGSRPTDAPLYYCAGLTYIDGTARLSCLPNQPAEPRPRGVPLATLAPNGQRPIYDPNRPPVFLPISGAPIEVSGLVMLLGGFSFIGVWLIRRRRE
jgi:uncharacterized repeat protein (TIGR01451 family)